MCRYKNISQKVNALISYTLPSIQWSMFTLPYVQCTYIQLCTLNYAHCWWLSITCTFPDVPHHSYHVVFTHFSTRTFDEAASTNNIYMRIVVAMFKTIQHFWLMSLSRFYKMVLAFFFSAMQRTHKHAHYTRD